MALTFYCNDPKTLLDAFNAHILQTESLEKITTWLKSNDGKYYTHRAKDWTRKAWFKPSIGEGELVFNIIKPQNQTISAVTYAYYHGHLTETFLTHFDSQFSTSQSTALPVADDRVS